VVSGAVGGLRGAEYNTRTCVQSRPKPAGSYTYSLVYDGPGCPDGEEGAQETVGATAWPDVPCRSGYCSVLYLVS